MRPMLPGLRFLFAATLISASLLVFGMGAIALMRASHQQFASAPPGLPPEPVFAQAPQTVPSLSMLRVEPSADGAPRDVAPDPARIASLTSADRADERPAPVADPKLNDPAADVRGDAGPAVSDVAPADEKIASSDVVTQAPAMPEKAPEPAAPDTAPSPPAPIAIAPETSAPAATGSIAMPEDQPVMAEPVADPPLPQARPEVAAVSPVVEQPRARVTPKLTVKRKVRKAKAKRARPKTEKLPAVSSAPTLGSLFGASSN